MRINKWIPIVLAINIALLYFAISALMTYCHRNEILKSEQPITGYSILEVNCRGHRMSSTVKISYGGKDYYVGISRKVCKNIEKAKFFYDRKNETIFEEGELPKRQIVCFFVIFAFSLLLWRYPEIRKFKATRKEILKVRKDIFLKDILPTLKEKEFMESPFKTPCFGWCGVGYIYDMYRLRNGKFLELVSVKIPQGDKYIQIFINVFEVYPELPNLSLLKELEGIRFSILPNNEKEMRLDTDFIKGAPILSKEFWFGSLKLGCYFTKTDYSKQVEKLKRMVKSRVDDIDAYFQIWYKCHRPTLTKWDGELIEKR